MLYAEKLRKHQIIKDKIEIRLWVHYDILVHNFIPIPRTCPPAFWRMERWRLEFSVISVSTYVLASTKQMYPHIFGKWKDIVFALLLSAVKYSHAAVSFSTAVVIEITVSVFCSWLYHFAGVDLSWVYLVLEPEIIAAASGSWQRK